MDVLTMMLRAMEQWKLRHFVNGGPSHRPES
jgi:hypothetical protein